MVDSSEMIWLNLLTSENLSSSKLTANSIRAREAICCFSNCVPFLRWGLIFTERNKKKLHMDTRPLSWPSDAFQIEIFIFWCSFRRNKRSLRKLRCVKTWKWKYRSEELWQRWRIRAVSVHFNAPYEVENVNFMPYRLWLKEPNGYLSGTWQVNQCLFIWSLLSIATWTFLVSWQKKK